MSTTSGVEAKNITPTSIEDFLGITRANQIEIKPKWRTIHTTPNIALMSSNIWKAWWHLRKLFLREEPEYKGSYNKARSNRYFTKVGNIEILIKAWSLVIGAQCMLKSCQQKSDNCLSECPAIPVGLKEKFHYNRYSYKLYETLRPIMSQYGKVFDGIRDTYGLWIVFEKPQYKAFEVLEPLDVQGDVRALVRLATELLAGLDDEDKNPQINRKISVSQTEEQHAIARAWLPSSPDDGRFYLILACAILKFMYANVDFKIRLAELIEAFRITKVKPSWWKYFKKQLPEQSRSKLDFLFTNWTEHEFVNNLGDAQDLLTLLQLEWHEPSVKHLAFDLNLDRELELIEKKLKLLDRCLRLGKQRDFNRFNNSVDLYAYAGSWAQIAHPFAPAIREFYREIKNREALGLAHNFTPYAITEYDLNLVDPERNFYYHHSDFVISNEDGENAKNYLGLSAEALSAKSNNAFSKPIYFTPCIPTLYQNLEAAWKAAYPKHLANSRVPIDALERALRRHVIAAGFLVCAYSICQSCLEDCRVKERSTILYTHFEFYFYRHPLNDEQLRLFSSVFEIAAQYGRVWCEVTKHDLLPVSMECEVHALVRIATEITEPTFPYGAEVFYRDSSCSIIKRKLMSDEQVHKVIARSWLPTVASYGHLIDLRFLFILARQIGQFLLPDCSNCISPMKFVKLVFEKHFSIKKKNLRPKWWPIFQAKLPQSCRNRLEFIFDNFSHQTFLDNLGADEAGQQLLTLLGLKWDSPQVNHMKDRLTQFKVIGLERNHVYECFQHIDRLIKKHVQFENREDEQRHFIQLRAIEHGHSGSWTQLSDQVDGVEQSRQFHRVIDNAKHIALADKYTPVVLYEYVNDKEFIRPVYNVH